MLKQRYLSSLLGGLKKGGYFLANSEKEPLNLRKKLNLPGEVNVWTVYATTIALEEVGRASPNTTMLGVLLAATKILPTEYLEKGILWRWPGAVGEKNISAFKRAMKEAKVDPAKEVVSV